MAIALVPPPSLNIVQMYSPEWQDFLASAFNLGHRYAITTPRCVILATATQLSMLMARTDAQPAQLFLRARSHDVWEPITRDDYDQIVAVEYGDDEPIDSVVADALAEMKPYSEKA